MGSFNGVIASLTLDGSTTSEVLGATASQTVNVSDSVPQKLFFDGYIGVHVTEGVSGGFGFQVLGSIGGATFVIAGQTGIASVGNYRLGITQSGATGAGATLYSTSFPRPSKIVFEPIAGVAGFTVSIGMMARY